MPEYDNNMSGVLFKNDRKEKDTHPDYTGNCTVEGVDYWMNAWLKKSKAGKPFMSFSFRLKDQQAEPASTTPSHNPIADDDIPF